MDELEESLRVLIVSSLNLEDISPDEISVDEPLFGDAGLGLDSIDALELGVALRKQFGIKIDTVTENVKMHFSNIRSLAAFIREQKGIA